MSPRRRRRRRRGLVTIRFAMVAAVSLGTGTATANGGAPDAAPSTTSGAAPPDARDSGPIVVPHEHVIDFTDDEGIAGGDEYTAAPPEPLEHETLIPERYRRGLDAGPAVAGPPAPRGGCAGCHTGAPAASAWTVVGIFVWLLMRRRRAARSSSVLSVRSY